jgi:phenylalanyl-tRNA synthetase alpha chain
MSEHDRPDDVRDDGTPSDPLARVSTLRSEAEAAIGSASGSAELERLRVRFLGRKAELPQLLRGVRDLPAQQRGAVGKAANQARQALEALIETRAAELRASELDVRLAADAIDVTLPGDPALPPGRLHLITATRREIEDIFLGLGFSVAEGPEVELVYYNFDALNHDPQHPARQPSDTFYVTDPDALLEPDSQLLRVHTSPMQVRAMELQPPPLYIVVPGRVFRPDNDATHTPQFNQVEGLAVDEDITLADLKGTLLSFARAMFGPDRDVRLRPHFFPFTEPSVEVDVSCFNCSGGYMPDGSRCPVCKGSTWIEILGSGMVDPNVFEYVREHGYDPEKVQGFAFGMGIERIAMLKHGVPDLRLIYDNDVRMLEQFG